MKDLDALAAEASALRVCSVLSARFNFAVAAAVMRSAGIPVGRNWSETEAKVRDLDDGATSVINSKSAVLASLVELSSVHDKRVTWIDYSHAPVGQVSAFDSWVRAIKAVDVVDPEWAKKFPFPLVPIKKTNLKKYSKKPLLSSIRRDADYVYFDYFSVRSFRERVEFEADSIQSSVYPDLTDFYKIFGVLEKRAPCVDTVAVNLAKRRIEMRVDIPSGVVPADVQLLALKRLIVEFNQLAYGTGMAVMGLPYVDFRPLIRPLYDDENAGVINMMGFEAIGEDSSSNNTGRLVRRKGRDLRLDEFHANGAQGVNDIRPYMVEVSWENKSKPKRNLSIEIPGSIKCLYKSISLSAANLSGCLTYQNFDFLQDRLDHFGNIARRRAKSAATAAQAALTRAA